MGVCSYAARVGWRRSRTPAALRLGLRTEPSTESPVVVVMRSSQGGIRTLTPERAAGFEPTVSAVSPPGPAMLKAGFEPARPVGTAPSRQRVCQVPPLEPVIGKTGFAPATSCSPCKRAARLRHFPSSGSGGCRPHFLPLMRRSPMPISLAATMTGEGIEPPLTGCKPVALPLHQPAMSL